MKIVSLSSSVTDTLVHLGLEDEIVGVTPWCLPYLSKPKPIAGTYLSVNTKFLKEVQPDIVFLQSRVHDKLYPQLRDAGFRAVLVPLPTNIPAILSHIVMDVGVHVGRFEEARELAYRLAERVIEVQRRSASEKRRRVYVEYVFPDRSIVTAGALTYINDMIYAAGGLNIFSDKPLEFFKPDDGEVNGRNPELVLVSVEPAMKWLTEEKYREMRPVVTSNREVVIVVESRERNLAYFGPSFIYTLEFLVELLKQ